MTTEKNRDESYEDVAQRATDTLALLMRLADAESMADRGGRYPIELEHASWHAIATLLRTTYSDVQRLTDEVETRETGRRPMGIHADGAR